MNHPELIRLIISYTFLGVIVFTAIITCLSLVGIVKIGDTEQQKKLFNVLIVELLIGAVGIFFNIISLNANIVAQNIKDSAVTQLAIPQARKIVNDVIESRKDSTVDYQKLASIKIKGIVELSGSGSVEKMFIGDQEIRDPVFDGKETTFFVAISNATQPVFYYLLTGNPFTTFTIKLFNERDTIGIINGEIGKDGAHYGGYYLNL